MAEDQTPAQDDTAAAPPPGIRILAQFVRDLSFENPLAPQSLSGDISALKIDRQIELNIRGREDGLFELDLKLTASATREEQVAFHAEVVYGVLFAIDGVAQEDLEPILAVECPRYLFPFARHVLSSVTSDGGFPPLRIDPIDFASVYMARRADADRMAAEGEPA